MMERLRIEYRTGYMELNVEAFFPCKMPAMRKAARLINKYCTDEAGAELLSQLRQLADGYTALCDMYTEKAEGLPADSPQRRHWRAQFNKTEALRKRTEGNIRLISGGKKMADAMPECRRHGDCFASKGGRCACLKNNDFGGRDCPFYKPADTVRKEQRRQNGGMVYGNQQI